MAAEGLDVASPSADVKWTAEMSEKMSVPRHIMAGGEGGRRSAPPLDQGGLGKGMAVPDRILISGGNRHESGGWKPFEMDIEQRLGPMPYDDKVLLSTPPSTLTLQGSGRPSESSMRRKNSERADDEGPEAGRSGSDEAQAPEWFRHMGLPYSPPGSSRPLNPFEEMLALKRGVNDLKNRVAELEMESDYRTRRDFLLFALSSLYIGVKVVRMFVSHS